MTKDEGTQADSEVATQGALDALDPFSKAILFEIRKNPKVTDVELAKTFKATRTTIRLRRKHPDFIRAERDILKPALKILEEASTEVALNVVGIHRRNLKEDDDLSLRAADRVLRPVVGEKSVVEAKVESKSDLTPEQFKKLADKVLEERE